MTHVSLRAAALAAAWCISFMLLAGGCGGGGGSSGGGSSGGGGSGGTTGGGSVSLHEGSSTGPQIADGSPAAGGRLFGSIDVTAGPSSSLTIVLVNGTSSDVSVGQPALSGAGAAEFVLNATGLASTLSSGGQGSFEIAFDPASAGSHTAVVALQLDGSPFSFSVSGTGTSAAVPGISIDDVSLAEGDSGTTSFDFTVSITAAPTSPVTLDWATADNTADSGDYTAASGQITFSPGGPTTQTVAVSVLGDAVVEPDESFFVNLSNLSGGATLTDAQGLGTVLDDDSQAPVDVVFKLTSSWSGGYNADIRITNTSSQAISGWTLSFDLTTPITSLWNGFVSGSGPGYTVTPETWTNTIAIGSSVTIGYTADGALTSGAVSNGAFNSVAVAITVDLTTGGGGGSFGSAIRLPQVDGATDATQFTVDFNVYVAFTLDTTGATNPVYSVETNNPDVVSVSINASNELLVLGLQAGRAGLRIAESGTSSVRYIGVRVKDASGNLPGLPDYISMGSVSEDTTADLTFWQDFQPGLKNKRMDIRYIYLNGGPQGAGWASWTSPAGDRARKYIRESRKLGIIPFFVYYNIPDGGESYQTDLAHITDAAYMEAYYLDLKLALEIAKQEGGDDMVGFIFEPDFLGYMAQNHPVGPDVATARVDSAYSAGVLDTSLGDPLFPNTFTGLVNSINYLTQKLADNVYFGWQMNLWASPTGGFTSIGIPGNGLMHHTDAAASPADFLTRRGEIYNEALAITNYYLDAEIDSWGADFVSIDKYGLDAGQQAGAPADPAASTWFWNLDHWNNYLEFCRAMHDGSSLPVILWQIPVGRINTTLAANPYQVSGVFPDLPNTTAKYEDSAPTFFLGDSFQPGPSAGARFLHFIENLGADAYLTVNGLTVTWGEHVNEAKAVGIISILFGAGVGISTDGVGDPPTEDYWWITRIQEYYQNPVMR